MQLEQQGISEHVDLFTLLNRYADLMGEYDDNSVGIGVITLISKKQIYLSDR